MKALKLALSIMLCGIISGTEDSDFSFAYFEFYEGNERTNDLLCRVPLVAVQASKDKMTDKDGGINCQNDEARSMSLCNGIKDTIITVFNDGEMKTDVSWEWGVGHRSDFAVITVTKTFGGCKTIPTFEITQDVGEEVHVKYYKQCGVGRNCYGLDGKVSSFKVEPPEANRFTLQVTEKLGNDDELVSSNKEYALRMQNDGNLVLYKTNLNDANSKEALWASDTHGDGESPYRLVMQEDNHLVVYDGKDNVIWASGVRIKDPNQWQKSGFATLQDDGNFVVRDGIWDVMWDSNTYGGKQGNYGEGNKHQASCDSKCENCNDGQSCNDWCSSSDWCGSSEDYQWTDCRACH